LDQPLVVKLYRTPAETEPLWQWHSSTTWGLIELLQQGQTENGTNWIVTVPGDIQWDAETLTLSNPLQLELRFNDPLPHPDSWPSVERLQLLVK
jgi:hypothetical protein